MKHCNSCDALIFHAEDEHGKSHSFDSSGQKVWIMQAGRAVQVECYRMHMTTCKTLTDAKKKREGKGKRKPKAGEYKPPGGAISV